MRRIWSNRQRRYITVPNWLAYRIKRKRSYAKRRPSTRYVARRRVSYRGRSRRGRY